MDRQEQLDKLQRLQEEYLLGLRTQEHLQDFKNFLQQCRQEIFREWQESQVEEWPRLKAQLEVLQRLEAVVNRVISRGKVAERELKELNSQK